MNDLKWWCWSQNNSGGEFIVDDIVAHYIWVQAHSKEEAKEKCGSIIEDRSWWCDCCGLRWEYEPDQNEGVNNPDLGKSIAWREFAVLHYALGHIKKVELK